MAKKNYKKREVIDIKNKGKNNWYRIIKRPKTKTKFRYA